MPNPHLIMRPRNVLKKDNCPTYISRIGSITCEWEGEGGERMDAMCLLPSCQLPRAVTFRKIAHQSRSRRIEKKGRKKKNSEIPPKSPQVPQRRTVTLLSPPVTPSRTTADLPLAFPKEQKCFETSSVETPQPLVCPPGGVP